MALGLGEGAEANASLAVAVIGGLSVSTFLTLVFVPTLYFIVETWRASRRAKGFEDPRVQGSQGSRYERSSKGKAKIKTLGFQILISFSSNP